MCDGEHGGADESSKIVRIQFTIFVRLFVFTTVRSYNTSIDGWMRGLRLCSRIGSLSMLIQYILNYQTVEYWKIAVAIFPSRQSEFPSELEREAVKKKSKCKLFPKNRRVNPKVYICEILNS